MPIKISAAKPDPFFWVEPDFGPKIQVESGRVGPEVQTLKSVQDLYFRLHIQTTVKSRVVTRVTN